MAHEAASWAQIGEAADLSHRAAHHRGAKKIRPTGTTPHPHRSPISTGFPSDATTQHHLFEPPTTSPGPTERPSPHPSPEPFSRCARSPST